MNRSQHIQSLLEGGSYDFSDLKKRKVPLDPEERDHVMKSGAVWHMSHMKEPTPGVWKAKTKEGKVVYGCNTHRAYHLASTLKGAIRAFPRIESTS